MSDSVKVPVELIADLDLSQVDAKDIGKTIESKLSGLKTSISKILGDIDTSKLNKALTSSLSTVTKDLSKAQNAANGLQAAMMQAGKSSDEYKNKVKDLDTRIGYAREQMASLVAMNVPSSNPIFKQIEDELNSLTQARQNIDPIDFVDSAQPEAMLKVANAVNRVMESMSKLDTGTENWNKTVDDNKLSDEYTEQLSKAEKLKAKLEELDAKSKKMEALGATDKQWESLRYDTEQVSKSLDEVTAKMREAVKTGSAFRFGEGSKGDLSKQINSIAMSGGNRAGNIQARAQKNESPYTKEYQAALDELGKLEQKMESIREKSDKMFELGASKEQFKSLAYDAEQLDVKVDEVKNHLMNMASEGKAFKFGNGDADAEIDKIRNRSDGLQSSLSNIGKNAQKAQGGLTALGATHPRLAAVLTVAGKIGTAFATVMKVAGKVGSVMVKGFVAGAKAVGKVASAAGKVISAVGRIGKSVLGAIKNMTKFGKSGGKTSGDMSKKFKKLTKNILMWGFGFRTAYYAIKRLRNIFMESFKVMGQSFDEVGQPMATMIESFNRLKGSLATAFQPIVSVVMPILTRLMNYLTMLLEAIGKFNAALTGQGHIYKAVAKNIDSTTMSAEEANKQLGSYDKLEVISSDSGGGSDVGYSYEKQEIDATSAASNFANMVKEAWAKADFTSVGAFVTEKLLGVLDSIETNLLPKITGFVNKILTSVNTFLASLGSFDIGGKVGSLVNTLINGIDWTQVGALLANLNNTVWGFLDGLVNGIDWATLGQSLATGITSLFANLNLDSWVGMISGLANGVTTALYNMLTNVNWAGIAQQLGTAVNNLFSSIDFAQIGTVIKTAFDTIWTFIGNFFATVDWAAVATQISACINNIFSSESTFNSAIPTVIQGLVTFFDTCITTVDWAAIGNTLWTSFETILTSLRTSLEKSGNPFFQALGSVFGAIQDIITALKPAFDAILPALMQIISAVLPVITELLPPIAEIISQAVTMVLPVLVSITQAIMPILLQLVKIILPIIQDLLTELQPIFDVIVDTVLPIIVNLLSKLMPIIERVLNVVVAILKPILQLIAPLIELVFNIIDPIIAILMPILDIITLLVEVIGYILTPILEILSPVISLVSSVFGTLGSIIKMIINVALQPIIDIIKFLVNLLMGVLKPAISAIQGIFNALCGVLEFVLDAFTAVFTGISNGASKLWNSLKKPLNAVLGGVESLANGVIKAINSMVKALNKLSFDVPDWIPKIGGKKFGFNLKTLNEIKIPRLAQGAVIPPNKEFLAMLGDQKHGTNIEAPLDTIKQALAEVMADFGGGSHAPIVLQVDGKTVAKVVWDEEAKYYKQTGKYSPAY